MKRVYLKVTGKVQRVWFRDYVVGCIEKYKDVTGFVQNKEDGSVEILFEGEENILKALVEKVKQGSSASRVDEVREEWEEIQERQYFYFSRDR